MHWMAACINPSAHSEEFVRFWPKDTKLCLSEMVRIIQQEEKLTARRGRL
jgi:hypothetical protein